MIEIISAKKQALSVKLIDLTGREIFSSNEGMITAPFSKQLDLSHSTMDFLLKMMCIEGVR